MATHTHIIWGLNNRPISGCSSETLVSPHRHEQEYGKEYIKDMLSVLAAVKDRVDWMKEPGDITSIILLLKERFLAN
jgi:hypothetical protein